MEFLFCAQIIQGFGPLLGGKNSSKSQISEGRWVFECGSKNRVFDAQ